MLQDRPILADRDRPPRAVASDVFWILDRIVNVYFVGRPDSGDRGWTLVDAGVYGSAHRIADAAAKLYGRGARPAAIVLTHGHFDHVGALRELAELWEVPIYAHELEHPYLTGKSGYPPPDPTVGGGLMARVAGLYPRGPLNVSDRLRTLPADGALPAMPGWQWIHTPGHTAGHVSLWRPLDRLLIAGDAFVTTKQESALAVLEQRREIHGPPAYFTPDWGEARESVRRLAELNPWIAATGHGVPMFGERMQHELRELAERFTELGMPARGRYVGAPAITDAHGVVSLPPPVRDPLPRVLAGAAAAAVMLGAVMVRRRHGEREIRE